MLRRGAGFSGSRRILNATVGLGDKPTALGAGPALMQGMLPCIEDKARKGDPAHAPADDAPGGSGSDKGDIDEPEQVAP